MEKNSRISISKIVVITVPIYKSNPTINEQKSFKQLLNILGKHEITIFTHTSLDLSCYFEIADGKKINIEYFDYYYFENVDRYSQLLRSKKFYLRFMQYTYLLIYQLDAWVFKDDLTYWCKLNYDYIGAPWFASLNGKSDLSQFIGVGNGGLSLRKISSHLKALDNFYVLISLKNLFQNFLKNRIGYTNIKNLLYNASVRNISHDVFAKFLVINEDIFWNLISKKNFDWYKVPDMTVASKFSFEVNAKLLYELHEKSLPFGCHAWEIYDTDFWKEIINL